LRSRKFGEHNLKELLTRTKTASPRFYGYLMEQLKAKGIVEEVRHAVNGKIIGRVKWQSWECSKRHWGTGNNRLDQRRAFWILFCNSTRLESISKLWAS
jgi:hypothetical protein